MGGIETLFFHFVAPEIGIRLQGPLSSNGTGRVEVFYDGQWGTICGYNWDINDATVVCRQLGYRYAIRALSGSQVEGGTGQIWLDRVSCNGSEQSLTSCRHRGWGRHNCYHYLDAGVECYSAGKLYTVLKHAILHVKCICIKPSLQKS
jgi:hypothetical protein